MYEQKATMQSIAVQDGTFLQMFMDICSEQSVRTSTKSTRVERAPIPEAAAVDP